MTDILLAVDAGTSQIKAVAFDIKGEQQAVSSLSVKTLRPQAGHVEQDMTVVWKQTATAIRRVIDRLPEAATVNGLAITGQGDGLWAVDSNGEPVQNAILWSDSRAASLISEWKDDGTLDVIRRQCGSIPYPGMSFPLLAWLSKERPDVYGQIETILSAKDWITYQLTGVQTIDQSEATVPYLDWETEVYGTEIFEHVNLPNAASCLPTLSSPTAIVGEVSAEAAKTTGLSQGLPVVSGPFDAPAAVFGNGAVTTGIGSVTLGTSLTQQMLINNPMPEGQGVKMALGVNDLWTAAIGSNAGTQSLEWAAKTIAGIESIAEFESIATEAPPGCQGVMYHPYLSTSGERGPFTDPAARAQFIGLTPEHKRQHIARAVYEGLSFTVRDCLEHLPEEISSIRASGGGTKSELWCQLLADCTGKPVSIPAVSNSSAMGAAMMLAIALDEYPSLDVAADQMLSVKQRYRPQSDPNQQYERLYQLFVELRKDFSSVWKRRMQAYQDIRKRKE